MSDQIQSIDINEIMNEIRENIKKRGYIDDILSFEDMSSSNGIDYIGTDFNYTEFAIYLSIINDGWNIPYYRDIPQRGLKGFIKKVIRKILFSQFNPIMEEQSRYNANLANIMNQLNNYLLKQQIELEKSSKRITELEKRMIDEKKEFTSADMELNNKED